MPNISSTSSNQQQGVARGWNRLFREHGKTLYYVACVCIVIIAVLSRFYGLTNHSLWYDEARAAINSQGTISEVVLYTKTRNTSPILYPLILYAVQKVQSSPFTVRFVPALASVGSIALMLFLMPRLGIPKRVAITAGLILLASVEAIRHAQDVREYSIDALLTVLMTAGMLHFIRDSKKIMLCASLFIAPLLQYGLVLFSIAVLATLLFTPRAHASTLASTGPAPAFLNKRISYRILQLRNLIWPASAFIAGSILSLVIIFRAPWRTGFASQGYLRDFYYQGELADVISLISFAATQTRQLLDFHMTSTIPIYAIAAFTILLLMYLKKRLSFSSFSHFLLQKQKSKPLQYHKQSSTENQTPANSSKESQKQLPTLHPIAILCCFAIAISLCAGILDIYPYGGTRQNIYLGPIIALTTALMLCSITSLISLTTRQAWLKNTLIIAIAAAIISTGAVVISEYYPNREVENIKVVTSALDNHILEEDTVYVSSGATQAMRFYLKEKPENYHYRRCPEWIFEECLNDLIDLITPNMNRVWLAFSHIEDADWGILELFDQRIQVQNIVDEKSTNLWLVTNANVLLDFQNRQSYPDKLDAEGVPTIRSNFNIYLDTSRLIYSKSSSCTNQDRDANFFLHVEPVSLNDLPEHRKQYNFDNLNFALKNQGARYKEQCIASVRIPDYPIARIETGQFTPERRIWQETIELRENADDFYQSIYQAIQSEKPLTRSKFDIYTLDNQLIYIKEPCAKSDISENFFLHIIPTNKNELPEGRQPLGFQNLDFIFNQRGTILDGRCIAAVQLPEYDIASIRTGQWIPDQGNLWSEELIINK